MQSQDLELVTNLIRRLHVARKECRNYAPTHPVSVKASEALQQLLEKWFERHSELILHCDGHHFSISDIPLLDLGEAGNQLAKMFKEYSLGSISFFKGVAKEQLMILFKVLEEKTDEDMVDWINKALKTGGGGIAVESPSGAESSENQKESTEIGSLYNTSISVVRNVLEVVREKNVVDVQQFRHLAKQMVDAILDEPKKLFLVTTSHPDFREDLFDHSLDVAIVATSLAATLRRDRQWLEEIMFCGFLHDVGKALIPKEILYKPGKLDAAEWEIMMGHAELGGHLLYGVPGVGDLAPQIAFEHQAKHNLSGYPKFKFKRKLHPITQFVIIADTYSALTAVRAYKKPFSPGKSLAIMEEMSSSTFDPSLFNQFVTMTNFYVPGVQAKLATGEEVEILKTFAHHAMRPLVRVKKITESSDVKVNDVLDLTEKDPYSNQFKWHLSDTIHEIENVY